MVEPKLIEVKKKKKKKMHFCTIIHSILTIHLQVFAHYKMTRRVNYKLCKKEGSFQQFLVLSSIHVHVILSCNF